MCPVTRFWPRKPEPKKRASPAGGKPKRDRREVKLSPIQFARLKRRLNPPRVPYKLKKVFSSKPVVMHHGGKPPRKKFVGTLRGLEKLFSSPRYDLAMARARHLEVAKEIRRLIIGNPAIAIEDINSMVARKFRDRTFLRGGLPQAYTWEMAQLVYQKLRRNGFIQTKG